MGAETSSEAIEDRELEEGLARGVSEGEMFVEGTEEAGADSVVSKRRRGAVSDGKAEVVAMVMMCWNSSKQEVVRLKDFLKVLVED